MDDLPSLVINPSDPTGPLIPDPNWRPFDPDAPDDGTDLRFGPVAPATPKADPDTVDGYASIHRVPRDEAEVILAARLARRFAVEVRKLAGDAFLIRVGGLVDVSRGRRCPYGRYEVVRHYRSAGRGGAWLEVATPKDAKRMRVNRNAHCRTHTLPVRDADPVPDWSGAFATLPEPLRSVLPGLAATGFPSGGWVRMADVFLESGAPVLAREAGVSADVFARQFSGVYIPEADRWCGGIAADANFTGPVRMPAYVGTVNENPAG